MWLIEELGGEPPFVGGSGANRVLQLRATWEAWEDFVWPTTVPANAPRQMVPSLRRLAGASLHEQGLKNPYEPLDDIHRLGVLATCEGPERGEYRLEMPDSLEWKFSS